MAPDIINHGWVVVNNIVSIQWMDLPPAPDGILENGTLRVQIGLLKQSMLLF